MNTNSTNSNPMQVTPLYDSHGLGDCHVHHGDGVVAVLVGLSNAEAAGPIFTRLHAEPTRDGRVEWLGASMSEPVAGALVGKVDDEDTLELSWWGRVDVHVTTTYGHETHTGGEEIRTLTATASTPVRVVPRSVHGSHGSSLGRGTIMAAGAEIAVTPRPTTPDAMIEASSTSLPTIPAPLPAPEPEPEPEKQPELEPEPEVGPEPVAEPNNETTPASETSATPADPTTIADVPAPAEVAPAAADPVLDTIVPVPDPAVASTPASDPISARGVELVRGLRCRNGHHNHPRARLCSLCGDAMQNVSIFVGHDGVLGEMGERPPLGIFTLEDGHAYQIGHDTVIGRMPAQPSPSTMVIAFPDDETMSREHVAIDLDGWNVFVRDLGSSNGTGVRFPDSDTYVRLEPNLRYPLPSNSVIVVGRRWGTFTATSAAPTQLTP